MHGAYNVKLIFLDLLRRKFCRIFGPVFENVSKVAQNSELHKLCDEHNVVKCIKMVRFRWAGHVMRTKESDPAKKELEEDIARFGCKNWRINMQAREQWREVIEVLKHYTGM